MSEQEEWAFPPEFQPDADSARFDLDAALAAVVALEAEIPDDAFTASILGTERGGSAVVIRMNPWPSRGSFSAFTRMLRALSSAASRDASCGAKSARKK